MKQTPEMRLIIYRDGKYLEIDPKAEHRHFSCVMISWVPEGKFTVPYHIGDG